MDEAIMNQLLGIDLSAEMNEKVRASLMAHFCSVAVLLLLREWCDKQEDPRTTAGEMLMAWRKSVIEGYKKTVDEHAQSTEIQFGPFRKLLSESLAPQEKVDEVYHSNLDKVVKSIEIALGINP